MIYTKRISVGAFLKKGEDFKENDFLEIASEGKQVEGQFGIQDIFLVKLASGKEGNVNFNQTTINNLIDGYGKNSINWIGKKVKVWAILSNVQGNMRKVYYFLTPETTLDETTGKFIIPGKKEEVEEEVNVNEIPF